MVNGITKLFAKATGPGNMRKTLRKKTKSLRMLLKEFQVLDAVKTEIPKSVFGGDIFAMLSGRLQQLLQYPEQPEQTGETAREKRSVSAPVSNTSMNSKKEQIPLNKLETKRASKEFDPGKAAFRKMGNYFLPFGASNMTSETEPYALMPLKKDVRSTQVPEMMGQYVSKSSKSWEDDFSTGNHQMREKEMFLFVKKLREYWQLNQQEQSSTQSSRPVGSGEREESGNVSSLNALSHNPALTRPWPEITGQQLARNLRTAASGRGVSDVSKRIQQTIQSSPSEKIEIQNIFNIEMKSEDSNRVNSATNLSEKIADILREQALQHGIDIT